jgi:hypothetical protein
MKTRLLMLACLISFSANANNMLVQNVTTLGNDAVNKTIQVQFNRFSGKAYVSMESLLGTTYASKQSCNTIIFE